MEPPRFKSYKPGGAEKSNMDPVELLYEEYEALKLTDYDGLHHHEAGRKMGISRPTFARIYESARKKIAMALVEVREIITVYGNVEFDHHWFQCAECHARFTLQKTLSSEKCPMCSSELIEPIIKKVTPK